MRTPKLLYAQQRLIYQPEWPTCPHGGEVLVMCNYLAWDKTVQTLDQVLSVANRPGRCPQETCPGSHMRLLSAQAQSLASPGSTYGYDVVVRIGWLRYQARATYRDIHHDVASHVRISESHIRSLSQHLSLPLLACHERQHRDHLAQVAESQGGLIIALDGLAPQGGEPQMWFIRALTGRRLHPSGTRARARAGRCRDGHWSVAQSDVDVRRFWGVWAPKPPTQGSSTRSRCHGHAALSPHALSAHAQRPTLFSPGGNGDLRPTRQRGPLQSRFVV